MTLHRLDPDALDGEMRAGHVQLVEPAWPPNYFLTFPKVVVRSLMAECSGAEFKVLCFIVDRVMSYREHRRDGADVVSYRQMEDGIVARDGRVITRGTGLGRNSIVLALRQLEDKGFIRRAQRLRESGGRGINRIELLISLDYERPGAASGGDR